MPLKKILLEQNVPSIIQGLIAEQKQRLDNVFPGRFSFTENRDMADYIYEVQSLAGLAGKSCIASAISAAALSRNIRVGVLKFCKGATSKSVGSFLINGKISMKQL